MESLPVFKLIKPETHRFFGDEIPVVGGSQRERVAFGLPAHDPAAILKQVWLNPRIICGKVMDYDHYSVDLLRFNEPKYTTDSSPFSVK
jgi:hypothetical protein